MMDLSFRTVQAFSVHEIDIQRVKLNLKDQNILEKIKE